MLIRIAACKEADGMSIPQLSEAEGITPHYVAKLTRILRMGGFINSTPGYKGGYVLAQPANQIVINHVLKSLGGPLFDKTFCGTHLSSMKFCTHSVDCSSRSLWQMMQLLLDNFLDKVTLQDLVSTEEDSARFFYRLLDETTAMQKQKVVVTTL